MRSASAKLSPSIFVRKATPIANQMAREGFLVASLGSGLTLIAALSEESPPVGTRLCAAGLAQLEAMSTSDLSVSLNDHLAGSTAALDILAMLKRLAPAIEAGIGSMLRSEKIAEPWN
jgi:hypothetical protein